MFDVWIYDLSGNIAKKFDNALEFSIIVQDDMEKRFPEIIYFFAYRCSYIFVLDDDGEHFYPLCLFSAHVG